MSLDVLYSVALKRETVEGGTLKLKRVVAKRPQAGPSLEAPSTSTKAPVLYLREAVIATDDDQVMVIPVPSSFATPTLS